MKLLRYLLTAGALAATYPAAAQVDVPLYMPVEEFGWNGPGHVAPQVRLTAAEETQLRQAVANMERFPAYLYSGCHDRAHAAYMLLPAALRPKLKKIWVLSPGRYTSALYKTLGLKGQNPAAGPIKWGYHVALAYDGPSGTRVFDPALKPGEVITRGAWFGLMDIPKMSLWMLTRGNLYNFNTSESVPAFNNVKDIWNGNAFNYEGTSLQENWIPANIARDAVGADAVRGQSCPEINAEAANPDKMLKLLNQDRATLGSACQPSIAKFDAEKARWITKLGS